MPGIAGDAFLLPGGHMFRALLSRGPPGRREINKVLQKLPQIVG